MRSCDAFWYPWAVSPHRRSVGKPVVNASRIGVHVATAVGGPREALALIARAGAGAAALDAAGPLSASELSQTGRRELRHAVGRCGLKLACLSLHTRAGLDEPERCEGRLELVLKTLRLAADLGAAAVVHRLPTVPEAGGERRRVLDDALEAVAAVVQRTGVRYALRASGTPAAWPDLPPAAVAWCLDPAAVLRRGDEPGDWIDAFPDRLAVVAARDQMADPAAADGFRDVPFGQGAVDWPSLSRHLAGADYRGPVVIESLGASSDAAALERAVAYLDRLFGLGR